MNTDDSKNPVADRFGVNLRRCRHNAGLSQETLSFRASIHRTEVGLLERGKREPKLGTIVKLARSLSVPPADLLSGISWNPDCQDGSGFECAPLNDAIGPLAQP
jgi:transcriptional regulator with XRE-family HTH domain